MKLVKAWEEQGIEIPVPFRRRTKVLFVPDKEGVAGIAFSHAILPPGGQTDYHSHDRPERIYVVTGEGFRVHNGEQTPIREDIAMWVPAGEKHQIVNTEYNPIKLATIFIPAYNASENYARCLDAAQAKMNQEGEI